MQRIGSRAQVMHGNAKMTGGGLKKKDLKYNKQGKIVSKKMSQRAKKEKRLQKAGYTTVKGQFGAVIIMKGGVPLLIPTAFSNNWKVENSHPSYKDNIQDNKITTGCISAYWATGTGMLPNEGKYRIQYLVDRIGTENSVDIYVGVASRANQIENDRGFAPLGCYSWNSYYSGAGSYLYADGSYVQGDIPQESRAGSTIEVIVDQNASTIEFWLEGAPVGNGGTACKLTVKPEHKGDLTPAACVMNGGSALTLVAVEKIAAE